MGPETFVASAYGATANVPSSLTVSPGANRLARGRDFGGMINSRSHAVIFELPFV